MDPESDAAEHVVVAVALVQGDGFENVLRRPLPRGGHRLAQQSGIEQMSERRLAHRSAASCRTRLRADVLAVCCEIQTKRRSSWAWITMKMLTSTR